MEYVMPGSLDYLEGRKFCVVFVKVLDPVSERVQLQCFRGRASIERGRVNVVDRNGAVFTVPGSAMNNIMENDGSKILKDADYFCLVKTDDSIELMSMN
jgi:hypothetical protein